jgi:hypothetical protein
MSVNRAVNASTMEGSMTLMGEKGLVSMWMTRLRAALTGLVAAMALVLAAAPSAQADLLSIFEASSASTQAGAFADARTNFNVTDVGGDPVKTMRFHLPVGLLGSISNFAACPLPTFYSTGFGTICPIETQVGEATVSLNFGTPEDPLLVPLPATVNVLSAGRGDVALLGVRLEYGLGRALIRVNVRPDDYGLDATIDGLQNNLAGTDLTLWGVPWDHWDDGTKAANKRLGFMANPATCGTEAVTKVEADSYRNQNVFEPYSATTPAQTGCNALRFEPSISVKADSPFVSGPSSLEFEIDVPQNTDPNGLATPPIRNVTTVLPEGLTINAALANGLEACSDAAFGKGSTEPSSCPAASRIGTAEFEAPALKNPHVVGTVYVGQPLPDDTYRLFVEGYGSSARVKLKGSARPDPQTGRLTAVFENNPEVQASSIKLAFKGGSRAPLAMPDTCGVKPVSATIDAWGGRTVSVATAFEVGQDAKGTPCAAQPFAPSFSAGAPNPVAGASSTFTVQAHKPDGQPDLTGVSLTLPPGLVANLKGNIGTRVGTARVAAGVGPSPFSLSGPVVLEGAYGDAPFSLRVTVPVIAGPFNLGDVVVRQKIYVDPVDTHVTVVSDPLPTIVKGVPVRLQNLQVDIDKSGFMKNPTSCAPAEIKGTLSSASGQTAPAVSRFQAVDCGGLGYTPQLSMVLSGKGQTKDGAHPALSARLTPPAGDANSKKVTVRLPLALALDPGNANGLCEPVDAARSQCAASTIVGSAEAQSVLPDALKAPVYFVRGERIDSNGKVRKTLPKLFMPLTANGVTVNIWASSDVENDRLVTTFENLPDAPFSSFDLNLNGGDHGILAVSNTNLCAGTQVADARYGGQNGKPYTSKVTMGTPCGVGVVKSSHTSTALKVTVGGLGAGKVSASGNGVVTSARTLSSSTTATLTLKLTKVTRRALARGRDVKVKVKVAFTAKGQKQAKTATKTVVLRGAGKKR